MMKKYKIIIAIAISIAAVVAVFGSSENTEKTEGKIVHLTDHTFDQGVSEGITIVDFWAAWCYPCRIQGTILDDLSDELEEGVKIAKVDVDRNSLLANTYQIRSIPTMLIFKNGKLVKRVVGVQQKSDLQSSIKALK